MNNTPLLLLNMSYRFDWEAGMVNRNYHVLQALLEESKYGPVISVDFIPFTLKKKLKVFWKGLLHRQSGELVVRGLTYRVWRDAGRTDLYHVTALSTRALPKILARLGASTADLTIWSYNPMVAKVLDLFPRAFVVFDAVDNWVEHPSYQGYTMRLREAYKMIYGRANVIFTVSESLIDFFGKSDHVYYVPNAVSAKHFITATANRSLLPAGISQDRPLVGYHGVIQSRVNFSIIEYISKELPDVQFVLVGPVWKESAGDIKRLTQLSNVFHRGMISYQDLPGLLQCFDLTIIPHKVDSLTQSMNPLKIYEYLACGKPIIATAIPGADQFQDLIKLAISPDDFAKKIRKALAHDSSELHERRQALAREHSWEKRIKVMLDIIAEHQNQRSE
ncbi:MAG: hypothetical protein COW24_02715 [Candidatus Kerfeldbacteria bacterium CG15_BIG_FIL_POST_REV_8_21_14_020_45_12]|uniref:Spore protein YkvP/CgeB glycosyl transferase-like domain-containing protein n=1 Tax=Candidatus Kerfeldbacteria bacterium CG15_BIG_FIL_POST_REV_8_21_14_020_45_12 TaxID=2014247 RepID=A0A2M7H3Y8_9BACT|nr:MAG: hypothetical protein COW24_02715 [Candidatus Kerfeldbacteria bacterium CG15_BIG_FIL_POST_REV_8_21_14_020_45_12]PJA93046.1 MAG: hypothetical protein CO132_04800 [Candidatus Kerfeldbacteria bacterium CG_4_9_14_3_um_filter_45_8]